MDLGSGGPMPLFVYWEKWGKLKKYKSELVGNNSCRVKGETGPYNSDYRIK